VTFVSAKVTKTISPGTRDTYLAFLAPPGARQLAGRIQRASAQTRGSLKDSRWGCGTRRALRGPEATFTFLSTLTNLYLTEHNLYFVYSNDPFAFNHIGSFCACLVQST